MKKEILIFLFGFFSCLFIVFSFSTLEVPRITGLNVVNVDEVSPSDWVSLENIIVLEDRIILKIENASVSSYASTGSMRPFFDNGANGIRIKPEGEGEINVGDIVSYRSFGQLVVHRVFYKGVDSGGVYFIVKGDNNDFPDKKIRFEDVEWVTVGVIY